jgi:hypothetical protein
VKLPNYDELEDEEEAIYGDEGEKEIIEVDDDIEELEVGESYV